MPHPILQDSGPWEMRREKLRTSGWGATQLELAENARLRPRLLRSLLVSVAYASLSCVYHLAFTAEFDLEVHDCSAGYL